MSTQKQNFKAGIENKENILTADDYVMFESRTGDPLTTIEQAERSMAHQLFSIAAVKNNETVGIARLLGDAAIFCYINDVWVLPEYQGESIGSVMVKKLIQYVKETRIPGTFVSLCLMCAKGKEGFYEKLGFQIFANYFVTIIINLLILIAAIVFYRYIFENMRVRGKLTQIVFIFLFSATICSTIDRVFWKGFIDYIRLEGFFTFDIKDCYVTTFIFLSIGCCLKYQKEWNNFNAKAFTKELSGKAGSSR